MKDYIEIIDQNNNKRIVEVITTFKLEPYNSNYIIYKELDNSHNYVAKYKGEDIVNLDTNVTQEEDIVNLDTNVTQEEVSLIEKIFEGVLQ